MRCGTRHHRMAQQSAIITNLHIFREALGEGEHAVGKQPSGRTAALPPQASGRVNSRAHRLDTNHRFGGGRIEPAG